MDMENKRRPVGQSERGAALIIALALVLALTVLVAATQLQVVAQLKVSKTERDYERALQMAEAGANAYLNMLVKGTPDAGVANASLVPQPYTLTSVLSLTDFKTQAKNGTIAPGYLIYYPAGQTQQGYFAGQLGSVGLNADIIAYGWSNGVVRRVRVNALTFGIFDWAALWGINPNDAWDVGGDANIIGGAGGEGRMEYGNNNMFYDGPLVMCTSAAFWADANGNNTSPAANGQFAQSAPDLPDGHVGSGEIANPAVRRYGQPLGFPTADKAADEWALSRYGTVSTSGVAFMRTHNDNATGLRYLMKRADGTIYEWPGSYSPTTNGNDYTLDLEDVSKDAAKLLKDAGSTDTYYGLRVYPGTYYFTEVDMRPQDRIILRSYNDADRTDSAVTAARPFVVEGDPANPNAGMAGERNIRFFIGHATKGSDEESQFEKGIGMEYPRWASRFRVFNASKGGVKVRGSASGSAFQFNVNMLNYNKDASGYYGQIDFTSGVYMRGSLIAWSVDVQGGTTLEKQSPELAPDDQLTYTVLDWTELP